MNEAGRIDARVALLEVTFVAVVLFVARHMAPNGVQTWTFPRAHGTQQVSRNRTGGLPSHVAELRLREGLACALRLQAEQRCDEVGERRAWKLFALIPLMLLHRPRGTGSLGRDELARRVDAFNAGPWRQLIDDAVSRCREPTRPHVPPEDEQVGRGKSARARHVFTGASLAPKTEETFQLLQGRRSQVQVSPIAEEVMQFSPAHPVALKAKIFMKCLSGAPLGSAPGPGGCTNEMLRVCLEDSELLQLLRLAAEDFARGTAPEEAMTRFKMATALRKKDGGVRGIATGTTFRRLVARTLARQFMREVEKTCASFQFALSTRAGTDCVAHAVRATPDLDPHMTVLPIDGIGAYDHVYRSAMLGKLLEVERLRGLLPFVRTMYSGP